MGRQQNLQIDPSTNNVCPELCGHPSLMDPDSSHPRCSYCRARLSKKKWKNWQLGLDAVSSEPSEWFIVGWFVRKSRRLLWVCERCGEGLGGPETRGWWCQLCHNTANFADDDRARNKRRKEP